MKYEIRSNSSLMSMILATLLIGLALSADARVANTRFLNEHGFIELSNSHRMRGNARRLVGTTSKESAAATDDTGDDDTVSSGGKKSIASRTSSVPAKKRDDLSSSMSAHFVKPSTLAPSVAPPTPATVAPKKTAEKASTKKTNSASTSTSTTSNSSPTPAEAASTTTMYPTKADPEGSFASRTTTDGTANLPLSASMEFETAQTSMPVASNSTKLYSMQKPPTKNTTGEFCREIAQTRVLEKVYLVLPRCVVTLFGIREIVR